MDAVLGPGLGQHLQLDVGGLAARPAEIVLDGAHLGQVQRQAALPADGFEARRIGCGQRDDLDRGVSRLRKGERRGHGPVEGVSLDDRVGEQAVLRRPSAAASSRPAIA